MIYQLKVKKLGNFYEILAIKAKTGNSTHFKFDIKSSKSENNLIRAKNNVQELALANDFKYFFTLTFNPKFDRYDFRTIFKAFKSTVRYLYEQLNIKIKYLIVPEQHRDGAWHFHRFSR